MPDAGAEDVARAYEAGAAAQGEWEAIGMTGRSEVFARFGEAVRAQQDRLAMLDAIDGGMPFSAMRFDIEISLWNIRDWPTLVRWHGGRTVPATPGNLHYTSWKPYGVVGKIIPFNHPAMFVLTRALAPLIAGNSVIVKAAPQTPLSALAVGEIAREVFPPGVFNILTGGAEAGDAIVTHPGMKRIGFTGSVATGLKIQQRAATSVVKAVSLELGGKNPMIVFPDADMDAAVEGAVMGMNFGICSGQSCGSNSRTYVHRDLYEDFVSRVGERLEAMRVAPAYSDEVDMGPVVTKEHRDRVMGFVRSGREQGARLVTGGERPSNGSAPEGGYYIRPTLLRRRHRRDGHRPRGDLRPSDVDVPVGRLRADGERRQRLELGLTAGLWTNDLHIAHKTADRLEAGYIWINDSSKHFWGMPFGGMKNSGLGREESTEEYESYLEQKSVHTILREPAAQLPRIRPAARVKD